MNSVRKIVDKIRGKDGVLLFPGDEIKMDKKKIAKSMKNLHCSESKIYKDKIGDHILCKRCASKIYISQADVDRIVKDRSDYDEFVATQNETGKQYESDELDGMGVMEAEHKILYFNLRHPDMTSIGGGSFPIYCDVCGRKHWIEVGIKGEDVDLVKTTPTVLQAILEKGFRTDEAKKWVAKGTGKKFDEVLLDLRQCEKTINALGVKPVEIKRFLEDMKHEVDTVWFSIYISELTSAVTTGVHDLIMELRRSQRALIDSIYRVRFPVPSVDSKVKYKVDPTEDPSESIKRWWLENHGYGEKVQTHEITVKEVQK